MRVDCIMLGSFGIGWGGSHNIPSNSLHYRLSCCEISILSYTRGEASIATKVFVNE